MSPNTTDRLADVHLRSLKAELRGGEAEVHKLNRDAGDVLEQARSSVRLERKQMAGEMGLSHSLVSRGLTSVDDLGFHRLWNLSDAFWSELVVAIIAKRKLADITTTITLRRSA